MGCNYPWTLSLYPQGITSVLPRAVVVKSDAEITRLFTHPSRLSDNATKRRIPCWSPTIYAPNSKRSNDNVNQLTALVYDFDETSLTPKAVHDALKGKLAHVVHTSWSHTDDAPRFRLVIFLEEALSPARFTRAWASCLAWLGYTAEADRKCKDASRLYLLPATSPSRKYEAYMDLSPPPLDATKLPAAPPQPTVGDLVPPGTALILSNGSATTVADLIDRGPRKHKCTCPFEPNASPGSAFFRVLQDGRAFLQCMSDKHTHPGRKFWATPPNSDPLAHVPADLRHYVDHHIAYSAPQGVFYLHREGRWQIETPWRPDALSRHLTGKLPEKCGPKHVRALTETVLRRQVYGFGYSSTSGPVVENDEPLLNLYAPPDVDPIAGQFPRIREILEVLCDGHQPTMQWLIHWSAALVQRPERRGMVSCLVISPQQGVGKSMFGNILKSCIGTPNTTVVSTRALRDNFNASYVAKLLVLADEVGIRSSHKDVIADLKAYITDERVHCAAPYAPRIEIENRMTWWMTSNEAQPLLIEEDDRRFTVLLCGHADSHYRDMLRGCFNPRTGTYSEAFAREVAGFSHALHKITVNYGLIARPMASPAKKDLQGISLSSAVAFSRELQKMGAMGMIATYPPTDNAAYVISPSDEVVPCSALYQSYRTWCDRHGVTREMKAEGAFRLGIAKLPGVGVRIVRTRNQHLKVYTGLPVSDRDLNVVSLT